jgi:ElaB/YqjD/DUF883 family membrane-anchored ribosome-binding protein
MKTTISLCLALLAVGPVSAQIFRPEAVNGALLGGIAGAVIGHNSGSLNHNGWQGAAIGAGVGAVLGSAVANERDRDRAVYGGSPYIYRDTPAVVYRGGYGGYYGGRGGYYGGVGYYGGGYYGGSAAWDGLFLGGLAGAIIGHNSGSLHHNGWRGAAWGAGAGLLLGSLIDYNRGPAIWERPVYVQPAQPAVAPAPAPQAQPQQVTIINNYYGNAAPMAQANSMFGR